jgi:hypothetical protein
MSQYNDFLAVREEPTENELEALNKRAFQYKPTDKNFDQVRFGLPTGTVQFEKVQKDREILISHLQFQGYDSWPYARITPAFRKHVAKFRASLDFWEQFSKAKVFSKEELYYRCLSEGSSFTNKVKKMRNTCYRAFTSETDTEIDEDLFSPTYDGYNSILHERYLIHWDDRKEVDDVKYAFIAAGNCHEEEFRSMLDEFWTDLKLSENIEVPKEFDMIGALKNTKMYDPLTRKTALMRSFWDDDIDVDAPYFAKRTIVPTTPGSTRDTGIGDPSTILKVKQLNTIARSMSELIPYSANTDSLTANARMRRVLKNNLFLHLDFKKFGLTFPRGLMNVLIEEYGKRLEIDTSHLLINDFYVEIEEEDHRGKKVSEVYQTERGTMLGWLDSINSICVSIILHHLGKELKFDHVTFNDDVEISTKGVSAPKEKLEILRATVLSAVDYFDIPVSLSKTFGSKASVFLERYAYYDEYNIDMYKEQLTVEAYSKSCVTRFPWQAKFFFAAAYEWTKSNYARDRCIDTCPIEFRKDEIHLPLWSGGWYLHRKNKLDLSLKFSDRLGIELGMELSRFRPPKYTIREPRPTSNSTILRTLERRTREPLGSHVYRHANPVESIRDINLDVENIAGRYLSMCQLYPGRESEFPDKALYYISRYNRFVFDGGGPLS